jgi:hypothetical protein
MNADIAKYNNLQSDENKLICQRLADEIHAEIPELENKIWHGAPVWFADGNPIVGYSVRKHHVALLFWSGQSFNEPGLKPEGTFKAAEVWYTDESQINSVDLKRWVGKSVKIQWDYKNIVKRRGKLIKLTDF